MPVEKVLIALSPEALEFLCGTTNGVSNCRLFVDLLNAMHIETGTTEKRGITITLQPGQVELAMSAFEERWGIKRKQARGFVDRLAQLNLVRRNSNKLTTIIDIICVWRWMVNGRGVQNPLYPPVSHNAVPASPPMQIAQAEEGTPSTAEQTASGDECEQNQPNPHENAE